VVGAASTSLHLAPAAELAGEGASMAEWYYAQNNQQQGPVSATELKQMAAAGELRPADLIWREGMQDWIPASSAKGLFSERTAAVPSANAASLRRRRDPADVDDYPQPRALTGRGLSTGAKVGIIVGIVSGVLVMGGVVVLVVLLAGGGSSFTLRPGERRTEFIEFQANREAHITIRSDVTAPGADVDLEVFDGRRFPITADTGPEKDCHVRFLPRNTQRFRIEIVNLGPGTATCNLSHNGTLHKR
jgi:hypothetical protein